MNPKYITVSLFLLLAWLASPSLAQDADHEFFNNKVKPLLKEHCWECHRDDVDDLGGNLAISSQKSMLHGGDSGSLVNAARDDESLLLRVLSYEDDLYEMPPEGKLDDEAIEVFRQWVKRGVPWDPAEEKDLEGDRESGPPQVNDETKGWWSFQKVVRPAVPTSDYSDWINNEIDNFIVHRLERSQLAPAAKASKQQLIRRATYDLLGLPPTEEQLRRFLADDSPDAWENLIDGLLASPHYGEKWGRHWLDLVGYAESNSFERDDTKPFVWRYRDYVIESFNEDKPYDQFLIEQLAGDEMDQVTVNTMAATGFYRLGAWDDEPADPLLAKYDDLSQIVTVVGQSMMGLTVDCARCHDHKIDPIPQTDYYQMVSFFENIKRYGVRDHNSVLDASVAIMDERKIDEATREAHHRNLDETVARLAALEDPVKKNFEPVEHEEFKRIINRQRVIKKYVGKFISQEDFDEYVKLHETWRKLKENPPQGIRKILCVKELGPEAPKSFLQIRGNPHARGDEVQPRFLSVLSPPEPEISVPSHRKSTGRRLAFAKWLADDSHPLTARVIANRVWQYHFGRGIVRTPSDFGFQGSAPTHPKLLDWLASELIANGWKLKPLHKKIMMSQSYQMSTRFSESAYKTDPENDCFWRFNPRRLTAEEIRDSILVASGQLNLSKICGPSVYPPMPKEVLAGQSMPGKNWHTSNADESRRRSIYIHTKRSMGVPILETNDAATTDSPCPVRFVTTQPTQAIGLLNSEFTNRQASLFADSVRQQHRTPTEQVSAVLNKVLQREPTKQETERGVQLLNDTSLRDDPKKALQIFCLMALNLNEFVYLQ